MKRLFAITTVVVLCSVFFFVVICVAGNPVSKPMNAQWAGTLYDVGVCSVDPLIVQTVNVGKGVSSVLGSSNFIFVYCIDPNTLTGSGWGIINTAKGDALHLAVTNLSVIITETAVKWFEDEEIVGGTGMFENALGASHSEGTWTYETASFPYGTESPPLFSPPQGWVGTTKGDIWF